MSYSVPFAGTKLVSILAFGWYVKEEPTGPTGRIEQSQGKRILPSTLITCGFHIYKSTYLLKFICVPKSKTSVVFSKSPWPKDSREELESPGGQSPATVEQGSALPSVLALIL